MVRRVFVEKKKPLANEAQALLNEAKTLLGVNALEEYIWGQQPGDEPAE